MRPVVVEWSPTYLRARVAAEACRRRCDKAINLAWLNDALVAVFSLDALQTIKVRRVQPYVVVNDRVSHSFFQVCYKLQGLCAFSVHLADMLTHAGVVTATPIPSSSGLSLRDVRRWRIGRVRVSLVPL